MTEPTASTARERLETFLEEIERTNVDDLIVVALPVPDRDERTKRLAAAADAAAATGRETLVAEARIRAREMLVGAFARRAYDPTWFGLNWGRSLGRSADRAALFAAAEDAAVGVVVQDLVDRELFAHLEAPFDAAASMRGAGSSANPILRQSNRWVVARVVLTVLVVLTLTWGIGVQLVLLAFDWASQGESAIALFRI